MVKRKTNQEKNPSQIQSEKQFSLILHNDDVNTFDFVIKTLVEVCHHNEIQAEQCAIIAHYKGKCDVFSGTLSQIEPMFSGMIVKGLTVTMEEL
ncbi:MAG TPA: ATP-dependent Clp protease adaptor ClpS [Salinivirgaceae bacterium]|nr:ATP-dependent Clp protease adaptor ClpS [Salinivirgaceae bacterium]